MDTKKYCYNGDKKFVGKNFDTSQSGEFKNREKAEVLHEGQLAHIQDLQNKLYSEHKEGLVIIFQAMDAAGKDGAINHIMSGINPEGIDVYNFKKPSVEELSHDYLWRAMRVMPERGKIAIFNRSYYEDVLIDKVHSLYKESNLPDRCKTDQLYNERYEQIKYYEKYLYKNGIRVLKFFLNISKDEQKKQFLQRIDDENKNWKFSEYDMVERDYWKEYEEAYCDAINSTSTHHAPWYVIPSDKKWFSRYVVTDLIIETLKDMNPKYPTLSNERKKKLLEFREKLISE
ncbi:MAG: PPK2 family polyphosphate kinase [Eubacteriales bacterium]